MLKRLDIGLEHLVYGEEKAIPEHVLWLYCLWFGMCLAMDGDEKEFFWCFSNSYFIGSFEWICDYTNLDPNAVRASLLKYKINKIKPPRMTFRGANHENKDSSI